MEAGGERARARETCPLSKDLEFAGWSDGATY